MRAAPAVSCAICAKQRAHEHTGTAEARRHSLRNGLTAYTALSPEPNSFGLRRCRLDGSFVPVGSNAPPAAWHQPRVSGPHGFAVRIKRRSSCASLAAHEVHLTLQPSGAPTLLASTTSRLTFVTIAIRPSCRGGTGHKMPLIWGRREAVYICGSGWTTQIRLNLFRKLVFRRKSNL